MATEDRFAEAAALLDTWASASGVGTAMAVDGVSYWYGARLGQWLWLVDRILWVNIVDDLVSRTPGLRTLAVDGDADEGLVDAVRWIASRDGLEARVGDSEEAGEAASSAPAAATPAATSGPGATAERPAKRARRSIPGRIRWRLWPPPEERGRREMVRRMAALARDPERRLLVVQAHARQVIATERGPRRMNPYVGPIMDRLRGTRLEPFEVDIKAEVRSTAGIRRFARGAARRVLTNDVLRFTTPPTAEVDRLKAMAVASADAIASDTTPLLVRGIDLAPALRERLATWARGSLARRLIDRERIRGVLRRLHPAGILLADEYHRQDWMSAAAAEGIPLAAVQHGVIYRHHTGYIHRDRPATLRLPDRTYVFGRWERDLLTTSSVYRPDEVVVGGSPRLDLANLGRDADPAARAAVRAELGIAAGERLVVLSGTWGPHYRRFHYPISLGDLFADPIARVHVVVKLHPSERDEGPYRAIIEGLAARGGFAAPPVTTVRHIDLYRLLAAADAHLGIHSTLLTEAVVTGTPNLLATGLAGADLLGYVDARVAVPVGSAADIEAALATPREELLRAADRDAFVAAHFEPGSASQRIADDLLAWLP